MRRFLLGIALLFLLHVPVTARAVDGVLEINQACAVNTGCFAGDSPGYPVTLALPTTGTVNVRLTSNLTAGSGGTTFIEVTGGGLGNPSTVIDLNGFSMSCFSAFGSCTGSGIGVSAAGVRRVTVMNGGITNMGSHGVELGDDCVVKDMRISNSDDGLGVAGGAGCVVSGNVIVGNGKSGISVGAFSEVVGNAVEGNNGGITSFGEGLLVAKNVVSENTGGGIFLQGDGSSVLDNVVRNNTSISPGAGLNCGGICGYGRNVFTGNALGGAGTLIEIDTNLCGNNTTCP